MTVLRIVAATVSLAAISACGTHKSVAPIAKGSDPAASEQTYKSSQDPRVASLYQQKPAPRRSQRAYAAPSSDVEPVTLKPVTAVYQADQDMARVQPANYQAPTNNATTAPVVEVRKGDTVYAIGRRYRVDPKAIIAENNLRAPYTLAIGQKLRLPAASTPTPMQTVKRDMQYRVEPGDTLYAISRKTGVSVPLLAQANNLRPPYTLSPGQIVRAPGANAGAATPRLAEIPSQPRPTQSAPRRSAQAEQPRVAAATPTPPPADDTKNVADIAKQVSFAQPSNPNAMFDWPVRGAIVSEFGGGELGKRNDGINIAAPVGTPVRAAADGEVVYRGSELEGFGNLLLVKHADGFVTAYAHNSSMVVKKGDVVRRGQVIAKVGQTGAVTTPQLHFEIRQKLKSVDPVTLLETQ